jgi:hypothetical protein
VSAVLTSVAELGIVVPLIDVAVATPKTGVTSVGLVSTTKVEPVPVCEAIEVAGPTEVITPVRLLGAIAAVST